MTSDDLSFLSSRQRRSIPPLTEDPTRDELAADWTLSEEDRELVLAARGEVSRRRFAVQLCVLRRFARFLEAAETVPLRYVNHLAQQLDLDPILFPDEPLSDATESAQRERLRAYLGYRPFDAAAQAELDGWLDQHAPGAIERELFRDAEDLLRQWRVVLPQQAMLERMVAQAASRGREAVFTQLAERIPLHLCRAFDELLEAESTGRSGFFRLKKYPDDPKLKDMLTCLDLLERVVGLHLEEIDLSGMAPRQLVHLYDQASRLDAHELKRLAPSRRYPLLFCFLYEMQKTLLDHVIRMHDKLISEKQRESKNQHKKQVEKAVSEFSEGLATACDVLEALATDGVSREDAMAAVYDRIGIVAVRESLRRCREFQQLDEKGKLKEFSRRLSYLRRYLGRFYTLPIRAEAGSEPIVLAIDYLRGLDERNETNLPDDAPFGFMSAAMEKRIRQEEGRPRRQLWELSLALAVRDRFRSGDLFMPGSRDHESFSNLVYDEARWQAQRDQAYVELSLNDAEQQLGLLGQSLDAAARAALAGISANSFARVDNGVLRCKRKDELEVSRELAQLRSLLHGGLGTIRIEDLLRQIDAWTGFSRSLTALPGYNGRPLPIEALLAAVIALGTNLGVATMGQSAEGITVGMLNTATQWYINEETIKAANAVLVNFHHRLSLSEVYGDGTSSTSDGQRFGVRGHGLLGSYYPRYFGYYERAITIYTHVSDQHAVYWTQVISCGPREATYLLDGLLDNNTILRPDQHTADTGGYTDHIFGLCYLLGFTFMPRLKDIKNQRIYKMSPEASYGCMDPCFYGPVNLNIIREQWDGLVRLAASLRDRTCPAHLVIQRLANSPTDRLSRALTELGRIVKTIHILRYINEAEMRQWVQLLLNRGEFRHYLAKRIFFADHGVFRNADYAEIMNKASCLSLLCNAVLVWNTVHMGEHVARLRAAGQVVRDDDLARVSPLAFGHVIPNGTYFFDRPLLERDLVVNGLK